MKKNPGEIESFACGKRVEAPALLPGTERCQLVNCFNIITAKFSMATMTCATTRFVEFEGRIFEKRYEDGGGETSFYELAPLRLSRSDITI